MKRMILPFLLLIAVVALLYVILSAGRSALTQYQIGKEIRDARFSRLENMGSTRKLEILPLFENASSQDGLVAAHGVSYLVKTDHATILFDLDFDTDTLQNNIR